jgi:hypothetical protein
VASIAWDVDASDGGQSLASPRPDPANRFFGYTPDVDVVGPVAQALGDGEEYLFEFREDHFAHLEIHHLAPSQLAAAVDLCLWLLRRKPVTVTTDDVNNAVYTGLKLRPGTKPEIVNEDEARQHFTLRCDLRSSAPILVDYSA